MQPITCTSGYCCSQSRAHPSHCCWRTMSKMLKVQSSEAPLFAGSAPWRLIYRTFNQRLVTHWKDSYRYWFMLGEAYAMCFVLRIPCFQLFAPHAISTNGCTHEDLARQSFLYICFVFFFSVSGQFHSGKFHLHRRHPHHSARHRLTTSDRGKNFPICVAFFWLISIKKKPEQMSTSLRRKNSNHAAAGCNNMWSWRIFTWWWRLNPGAWICLYFILSFN